MYLELDGIEFGYARRAPVLAGFSLVFNHPSTVLLGPNGAGKSTLLALAATQLTPRRGHITWRGIKANNRRSRTSYVKAVAWLPQDVVPIPGLTVREQVAYMGWLKGMSRRAAWDASLDALARVQLSKLGGRRGSQLSGGQTRRMGIAGALTHRSELILLDEPTAGLDPTQRRVFRDLLENLSSDVHVVVSTHQTEDLADSYAQVVVLDRGKVRFQDTPDAFHALASAHLTAPGDRAESAYARLVREEA